MKHNYFFRKTLLAVALLLGGASFSWADAGDKTTIPLISTINSISTNQPVTLNLTTGTITHVNASHNDSPSVNTGSPNYLQNFNGGDYILFNLDNKTAQKYLLTFNFCRDASGDRDVTFTFKNGETNLASTTLTCKGDESLSNWFTFNDNNLYSLITPELPVSENITMQITMDGTERYTGNIANVKLFPIQTISSSSAIDLTAGEYVAYSANCLNTTGDMVYLDNFSTSGNNATFAIYVPKSGKIKYSYKVATKNSDRSITFAIKNGSTTVATKTVTALPTSDWTVFTDGTEVTTDEVVPQGTYTLVITFTGAQYIANIGNIIMKTQPIELNEGTNYTPTAYTNCDVTLTRSITTGNWSTIVLPFDMTAEQITSAFGAGSQVAQLTSFTDNKIKFTTVSSMNAHEPYLIKVSNDFSSATISGVTITTGTPSKTTVSGVDFIGSYDALTDIPFSDGNTSYYFLSGNTLYRSSEGTTHDTMKGFRAYFKVPETASSRGLTFDVNDEQGGTTGVNEELRMKNEGSSNAPVYNLNGQRISHPSKGLYIVNGKKVIIK